MRLFLLLGLVHAQNHVSNASTEILLVKGEELRLSCDLVRELEKDEHVIWKRNNNPVSGGDTIELVRTNAQPNDSGLYTCVYRDAKGFGTVSKPINVNVLDGIEFDAEEQEITGYVSGTVQMTCDSGVDGGYVKWFKNGEPVNESDTVLQLPDGSLQMIDLTKPDRGSYSCHVTLRGLTGVKNIELDIQPSIMEKDAPKLEPKPPFGLDAVEGEPLFIPCHAFDRAPDSSNLEMEWTLPNG